MLIRGKKLGAEGTVSRERGKRKLREAKRSIVKKDEIRKRGVTEARKRGEVEERLPKPAKGHQIQEGRKSMGGGEFLTEEKRRHLSN